MKKTLIIVVITLLAISELLSQTASQPLELPNFIIEGKEQIDLQAGYKQFPEYSTAMARVSLDSLNFLEKPKNYVVFPITLPNTIIARTFPQMFVEGSVGSFYTARLGAGYRTEYKEYALFGKGNIELSNGHLKNANYFKFNLGVQSDYLAPEKFFIFGGSKTTTSLDFDYKAFRLYALDVAPKRSSSKFELKLVSKGEFEGYNFRTGGEIYFVSKGGDGRSFGENSIAGFLDLSTKIDNVVYGADAGLNFRSFDGNPFFFHNFRMYSKMEFADIELFPIFGLQFANSTSKDSRLGILLDLKVRKYLNERIRVELGFNNGLLERSFKEYFEYNPYLADSLRLDYANKTAVKGALYYTPRLNLSFVGGAEFSYFKRMGCYDYLQDGYFAINYFDATMFNIFAEGIYENETYGDLSFRLEFLSSNLSSNKKEVPYEPNYKFALDYSKKLFNLFRLRTKVEYLGERFADSENTNYLSSYFDLSARIDYFANKNLMLNLVLNNLLNSKVVIWKDYRERGFAVYLGITYKFW